MSYARNGRLASFNLFANYATRFSRDLLLPSLPAIAMSFDASSEALRLSIALYLLGVTSSKLIFPALSDGKSTLKIVRLCAVIFLVTTIITVLSHHLIVFYIGRSLQGFAIGCLPLLSRRITFQEVGVKPTIKLLAYMSLIAVWSPALATTLGGYLQESYQWQASFYVLLAMAVCWLIGSCILSVENEQLNQHETLLTRYQALIKNKKFWCHAIPYACLSAATIAYFSVSSFLLIKTYRVTPIEYGYYQFIPMTGMLSGRIAAGKLIDFYSARLLMILASTLALFAGVLMMIMSETSIVTVQAMMVLMAIYFCGVGLANPTSKSMVMQVATDMPGTASAALGAFSSALATLVAWIASILSVERTIPLAIMMGCLAIIALKASSYISESD